MSESFAELIVFRTSWWLKIIERVEEIAKKMQEKLGSTSVVLYGSYARGDFNQWSDIDLLVVSERFKGIRVLDRYQYVLDLVREGGVEFVLLAPDEATRILSRPGWRHALKHAVIVVDHYNIRGLVRRITGKNPLSLEELKRSVLFKLEKAKEKMRREK